MQYISGGNATIPMIGIWTIQAKQLLIISSSCEEGGRIKPWLLRPSSGCRVGTCQFSSLFPHPRDIDDWRFAARRHACNSTVPCWRRAYKCLHSMRPIFRRRFCIGHASDGISASRPRDTAAGEQCSTPQLLPSPHLSSTGRHNIMR